MLLIKQTLIIFQEGGSNRKEFNRPRAEGENNMSDKSFGDSEAQAALLRNASIDSSLDNRNKGR